MAAQEWALGSTWLAAAAAEERRRGTAAGAGRTAVAEGGMKGTALAAAFVG